MIIVNFIDTSFQAIQIIVRGWLHLALQFYNKIFGFFANKSLPEKLFFCFLIIQMLSSGLGWIQYEIKFNDTIELVFVSARWNVIFILASLLNFFFTGFWRSNWVWYIFLFLQTLILILFGIATNNPSVGFTDMIEPKDYSFSIAYWIFAVSVVCAWCLGVAVFREDLIRNKKLPTIKPN
ncbi:hypothetical protein [Leptospira sp. GIMC2001]|uniref:hypothetical protein n=1 Tax=Leptospira sp. GIMC2001 TaxID=1513297 RepID=UPI00234B37DA|nr:hypothetical protein [Leptospira sp. GIMC2001]WCL50961.1 hypothetical protein O4O04_09160 [Leptospira sp. GIMC2001]